MHYTLDYNRKQKLHSCIILCGTLDYNLSQARQADFTSSTGYPLVRTPLHKTTQTMLNQVFIYVAIRLIMIKHK